MQFEIKADLVEGSPISELVKTYFASATFLNAAEDVKVKQGIMSLINEHFLSEIECACVMFDYIPTQEELTKMFYANLALAGQGKTQAEFIAEFYQRIGYIPLTQNEIVKAALQKIMDSDFVFVKDQNASGSTDA